MTAAAAASVAEAHEASEVLRAAAQAERDEAATVSAAARLAAEAAQAAAEALRAAAEAERDQAATVTAEARQAAEALRAAAQDEREQAVAAALQAREAADSLLASAEAEREQTAAAPAEAALAAEALRAAAQAERDEAAAVVADANEAAAALKASAQAERDEAVAAKAEAGEAAAALRAAAEQEREQTAAAVAEARIAADAFIASAQSELAQAAEAKAAAQESAAALLAEAQVDRDAAVAALAAAQNATSDTQQIKIVQLPPPPATALQVYEAIESERLRIARDLHDGPSQVLADLVLKAEILERTARKKPELLQEELDEFKGLVRNAMTDMRKFMFDLRPDSLDELGLIATMRRYANEYHDRTGIACRFKVHGQERRLGPGHEEALFKIIQEALTNVQRHAGAKTADVGLTLQPGKVAVRIRDDGVGFDTLAYEMDSSQKLGIVGMRERAGALGGTVEVKSHAGGGTEVVADFPIA